MGYSAVTCCKAWVLGLCEPLVRRVASDKLLSYTQFLLREMHILDLAFCPYWFCDSGGGNILDTKNGILIIIV